MKKCIYFDGRVDGAAAAARAQADRDTVTRDASVFLQIDNGIEKFEAVLIPASKDFDALAERHEKAGADVYRPREPAPVEQPPADQAVADAESERQRAEAEAAEKAAAAEASKATPESPKSGAKRKE